MFIFEAIENAKNMLKYLLLPLLAITHIASAQVVDKKLQYKIDTLLKNFNGVVGVYVHHLTKNKIVLYNADTIFPTASIVKVPIMIGIMHKIETGELGYQQNIEYRDSLYYAGEDILASFKDSEKIHLSKALMLMLTTSDNTASLWLQKLAGTGTRINQIMDSLGFTHTRVNSRTPGREANRTMYGWGQTTPREMTNLLIKIFEHKIFSPAACERMLRLMSRQYWDGEALSMLPPTVQIFTKNGAVNKSRSETMIIMAPHGPIAFTIITKNQQDESWDMNNQGWLKIRQAARLVFEHYEPKFKWQPLSEADRKKWF
jgi:beta-lactamase class A